MTDNASNTPISSAAARWFAVGMTIIFAVSGVWQFVSIGTPQATLWAVAFGVFPIAGWLEASRVRSRGNTESANRILMAAMSVQMVLWLLAMYAADLAEGSSCN